MFNPFKGLGDLKTMRDQAVRMQQALAGEEVVVEKKRGESNNERRSEDKRAHN